MISDIQYEQILEDVKYSCGDQIREKILEGIRGTGQNYPCLFHRRVT
jgi:hypothetical protein